MRKKVSNRVPVAHASLRWALSPAQKRSDAQKIFSRQAKRQAWWITGTEALQADQRAALKDAAKRYGYRVFIQADAWVAVNEKRIDSKWDTGFVSVLSASDGKGKHSPKGITWVSFHNKDIGKVTIGSSHYLTKGSPVGEKVNLEFNRKLAAAIGEWGKKHSAGSAICFYGGDQNINDKLADTFLGRSKFVSLADRLRKWFNTGHGPIDVIASWSGDHRVQASEFYVLNDKKFKLFTDHFLLEGAFKIYSVK